jgi:serine/threonine protein kinase
MRREHCALESWLASRIDNPHVLKVVPAEDSPRFLYVLSEYIPGQTLTYWIAANPRPSVERVLKLVEQLVRAVRALHRRETMHQDICPDNILIGPDEHLTLIDFGSCRVAGIAELALPLAAADEGMKASYGAPECRLGHGSTVGSELFSIAVVMYEMLTGAHPYGESYGKCRSYKELNRLRYRPAQVLNPMVPIWMDAALEKAVQMSPELRYAALSEFVWDLEHPNPAFLKRSPIPLAQRHPLRFWQSVSALLLLTQLLSLWLLR